MSEMIRIKLSTFDYRDRENNGYTSDEVNRRDVLDTSAGMDFDCRCRLLQQVALALGIDIPDVGGLEDSAK